MRIKATVVLSAADLVKNLNQEDLLKLVKNIDEAVAEWEFTLQLCDHFDGLRKEHTAEVIADETPARIVGTYPNEVDHE